jgi:hypothetical protein
MIIRLGQRYYGIRETLVDRVWCPIIELRQYTVHPSQRDVLIDLFDREFVESQEGLGMAVLGQFRDLDRSDRFVWMRGFNDMPGRAEALGRFYGGPVWKAHSAKANATMIDSDDVLLLRPASPGVALPPSADRPPLGQTAPATSTLVATVYYGDVPFDRAFPDFFHQTVLPVLVDTGARPFAVLQTVYAENTFPALPVREGVHAFAWLARFVDRTHLEDHERRLEQSEAWHNDVLPALLARIAGAPQRLRLAPTARSLLR